MSDFYCINNNGEINWKFFFIFGKLYVNKKLNIGGFLLMWVCINVIFCNDIILNNYVKIVYINYLLMI